MMKLKTIPVLPLMAMLAWADEQQKPEVCPVKASPQSVECFYPTGEADKAGCRVRLHLTPTKGHTIRLAPLDAELHATDAQGNGMKGEFREWEICYGDARNTRCVIAVYDFPALPKGGAICFDTTVAVPVTSGTKEHEDVDFTVADTSKLSIEDIDLTITPSFANETDPDNTAFSIEYSEESKAAIAQITICDPKGQPMQANIVEGVYHEAGNIVRATYVLSSKHEKLKLRLSTYKPIGTVEVPVRFRTTIGR